MGATFYEFSHVIAQTLIYENSITSIKTHNAYFSCYIEIINRSTLKTNTCIKFLIYLIKTN